MWARKPASKPLGNPAFLLQDGIFLLGLYICCFQYTYCLSHEMDNPMAKLKGLVIFCAKDLIPRTSEVTLDNLLNIRMP